MPRFLVSLDCHMYYKKYIYEWIFLYLKMVTCIFGKERQFWNRIASEICVTCNKDIKYLAKYCFKSSEELSFISGPRSNVIFSRRQTACNIKEYTSVHVLSYTGTVNVSRESWEKSAIYCTICGVNEIWYFKNYQPVDFMLYLNIGQKIHFF